MATVVAITGAAHGIGLATAERLASDGYEVVLLDRDTEGGYRAERRIVDSGGAARFYPCDVTDENSVRSAFGDCATAFGPLGGLVNNAGSNAYLDPITATVAEWDAIFDLNVRGVWLCVREAVPLMTNHGAAIVNVASMHATRTTRGLFPYGATKSAVLGLTRSLALELGDRGIRVNAVSPGWTRTPLMESALRRRPDPELELRNVESLHPLLRIASASEVAAAIAYLLAPEASFITGTDLHVDGGIDALSPV